VVEHADVVAEGWRMGVGVGGDPKCSALCALLVRMFAWQDARKIRVRSNVVVICIDKASKVIDSCYLANTFDARKMNALKALIVSQIGFQFKSCAFMFINFRYGVSHQATCFVRDVWGTAR